ncbi:MAG: DUF4292 domain-containing protein [Muribaculaceae bacterium]|nr:DUF4292 domain-containing protein [Muribaculaceae bacterium]
MKRYSTKIALLTIVIVALASCSKKVVPIEDDNGVVIATSDNVDIAAFYQADWRTFKSGGNVEIGSNGKSLSSSMQMKMIRNKSIYVSVRPMLGIEAAKMVINGDSILLVDKLHKRYILEKASLLTNGIPVTVGALQDIFLGRAFELGKGSLTQDLKDDFKVSVENNKVILTPKNQFKGFDYNFVYNSRNNIVSLNVIPSSSGTSTYSVTYSKVQGSVAGKVATEASVSTKLNGNSLNLDLEYKDIVWNESFTIDTQIPKNYKRIDGKDIMQLLGGN